MSETDLALELLRREINDVRTDAMRDMEEQRAATAVLVAELAELRAMHVALVVDELPDATEEEIEEAEGEPEGEPEAETEGEPEGESTEEVEAEVERIEERIEETVDDVRPERPHFLHYNLMEAIRNR